MADDTNNTSGRGMSNVIPMPLANIDEMLADIDALVDSLIFMNEAAEETDRERVRGNTISLLYQVRDKSLAAHKSSSALHRSAYRAANR